MNNLHHVKIFEYFVCRPTDFLFASLLCLISYFVHSDYMAVFLTYKGLYDIPITLTHSKNYENVKHQMGQTGAGTSGQKDRTNVSRGLDKTR